MSVLVTGSSWYLGEALALMLRAKGEHVVGMDVLPGRMTTHVGSIVDRDAVNAVMRGVRTVYHTATLHKPHVATHSRRAFVDVNVTGTLNLLEESVAQGVTAFVYTSTTSVFGDALSPRPGLPAAWITEEVRPVPKNIYGVTKAAAEDLCELFHRNSGLAGVVLRTSRFFPEEDDNTEMRAAFEDANLKVNEFVYRRVDIEDVVTAHVLAAERAAHVGFDRFIVSATTPFERGDVAELRLDAPRVVARRAPGYEEEFARRGWTMLPSIDRVYVNAKARRVLGWVPRHGFGSVVARLKAGGEVASGLAREVGVKGYHRPERG